MTVGKTEQTPVRIVPSIVQRHAEDAAFYWARLADAARSTEHDWHSLQRMERLLDAHLEGLRVAQLESALPSAPIGDAAWSESKARLKRWGTADEAFVAGTLALHALEAGVSAWLDELESTAQSQVDAGHGDAIAVGLAMAARRCDRATTERMVERWAQQGSPTWRRAALLAAGVLESLLPTLVLDTLNGEGSPDLHAEAARLAGCHGVIGAIPALQRLIADPASLPLTRRAAAAAIGRLVEPGAGTGNAWKQAEAVLLDAWLTQPDQVSDEELTVWLWRAAPASTNLAIERMLVDGSTDRLRWREALRAMRFQGASRWMPLLLQCMEHQNQESEVRRFFEEPASNLARLAGDVFGHLAGVRIGHQRWREAPEAPDDDESMDSPYVPAAAKRDPDGGLLWPDVEVLKREWSTLALNFEGHRRYLAGEAVAEPILLRLLGNAKASQQQRWQAALLLQLARGAGSCFDVATLTPVQDRALADLGVTSWNW